MAQDPRDNDHFSAIITPREEWEHQVQLLFKWLTEQDTREQQQREDAEFTRNLDSKNLKELMQSQRLEQQEAERITRELDTFKMGDVPAYLRPDPDASYCADPKLDYYLDSLSYKDYFRMYDRMQEMGLPEPASYRSTTSFAEVKDGSDPAKQLEETKKWLKETFPSRPVDAILFKKQTGGYAVVSLGVSDDEVDMAKALQNDKRRAEDKSAEVTTRIQEKIREGSRKEAAFDPHESPKALSTPSAQRESTTRLYNG